MTLAQQRPVLIFWQKIVPGDLRKMEAQSNDAATGGGARDLRFPDTPFRPAFEKMFPEPVDLHGRPVRRGHLVWEDKDGNRREQVIEYWPPTEARSIEGRLARIHEIEPLRNPPSPRDGMLILLLVLDDAAEVRAFYATTADLRDKWHDDVAKPILECLTDERRAGATARGWLNLISGERYCHGG